MMLLSLFPISIRANEIVYNLSFNNESSVHIEAIFVCDTFQKVIFPSSFANNQNLFNHITNITFSENINLKPSSKENNVIQLEHLHSQLKFEYDVNLNLSPIFYDTFYAPFKKENLVHLIGAAVFAFPDIVNEETSFRININTLPTGWKVYTTYTNPLKVTNSIAVKGVSNLKEALVIFMRKGEHTVLQDTNTSVFLLKDDKLTPKSEIDELVKQCVSVLRKYWRDTDKFYIVNITTFDSLDQGVYYRATCFKNGITVGLSENFDYRSTLAKRILLHEITHNWIGIKLTPEDESKYIWFTEGFTEYIAWEILNKERWITEEEYVNHYNEVLRNVFLSEFRNAPYSKIESDFWNFPGAKDIPYAKGSLFALQMNYLVQKNSQAELWDVLHFLLEQKGMDKETVPITDSILSKAFAYFCKECQFLDLKRQYIDRGNDILLSDKIFGGKYHLKEVPIGQFELGFDWDNNSNIITDVKRESAAYEAGLREGATLLSHSIFFGHPETPVEIKIKYTRRTQSVTFLPQKKEKILVPQFIKN